MQNAKFWLLLVVATLCAMGLALPLAIGECTIHNTPDELNACIARYAWGIRIYALSFLGSLSLSIFLYARASRWALPSLVLTAVGPFGFMLVLATAYTQ